MITNRNHKRQTEYDRNMIAALWWLIGAALAFLVVTMIYGGAKCA